MLSPDWNWARPLCKARCSGCKPTDGEGVVLTNKAPTTAHVSEEKDGYNTAATGQFARSKHAEGYFCPVPLVGGPDIAAALGV